MTIAWKNSLSLMLLTSAPLALAAEEAPHEGGGGGVAAVINFYEMALHALHIDPLWEPTLGSLVCLVLLTLMGLSFRKALLADRDQVVPAGQFSLRFLLESLLEFIVGIAKDNTDDQYRKYMPFLASLFLYILVCNLSGLIPGFPPPTETMDNNVAIGLVVFLVYNYAGLKEHGAGYAKHFLGPVAFIAPLFFCIELVSHFSRPLSLGLRLAGNIYGDHTLLGVFTSISYLVFPALLMFFGLLVAVVQSFVFTLLSGIYISMAISHDH